ncbi:MAG: transposase [Halofilum sp. (in: g-proteobacteria)]|nr:transposase [Halofilum sp. (in: g-proteobacteria)]
MAGYRRARVPGGTWFFTLVTADRHPWLGDPHARSILADAMRAVRQQRPFLVDGIVVLPDHLHCIWTLPDGDSDFPGRWKSIKHRCTLRLRRQGILTGAAWQKHYWEHLVRDDADLHRHLDYIHYNPVKHGLCSSPADWSATSFHRYVHNGFYDVDWGGPVEDLELPE